ncbi:hypothetical protein HYN24_07280 [Dechloromonas sp. HYN0024]|nr:hypothetical protein HYN24_07280 [Dechloromonas sp. HYN0024]
MHIDSLIGDMFGQIDGARCFIVEFKQKRSGIVDEVTGGKPARVALFSHLATDYECRRLSWFGHFACYQDEDDLCIEPYASAAQPHGLPVFKPDYPYDVGMDQPYDFEDFYNAFQWTCFQSQAFPGRLSNGLGLTEYGIKRYLKCVFSHMVSVDQDREIAKLIEDYFYLVFIGKSGPPILVPISIRGQLMKLAEVQKSIHSRRTD